MNDYERIADLIERGKKIEAIKLLRERTGVSLAEAKAQVEQLSAEAAEMDVPTEHADPERSGLDVAGLPEDVLSLARAGRTIEAIGLLRERTGMGLKEAKERIEAEVGRRPDVANARVLILAIGLAVLLMGIAIAVIAMAG